MNAGQLTSSNCILSDEERRLLREYRLTTIPSRRSSKSSTPSVTPNGSSISAGSGSISSASSSSCSSSSSTSSNSSCISSSSYISSKSISIGSIEINDTTDTGTLTHSINSDHSQNNQDNQLQIHIDEPQKIHLDYNPKHHINQNNQNHQNHNQGDHQNINRHHHHHHNHHHHRSNHKRHRINSSPTLELSPEALSDMLELSSNMSILRILGPGILNQARSHEQGLEIDTTNGNKLVSNLKNTTGNGDNRISNDSEDLSTAALDEQLSGLNYLNYANQKNRPLAQQANSGATYIFEKVDYLKKLNMRRKASKKTKKSRKKSSSKSTTTNGRTGKTTNKST